ncbi:Aste57867_23675 [Aphanomyces stellatus]|uniref:Aste57867_23675 protein n=1 Tax=Aphanomyces stellatus TaxID=120398 RepID=A0A485LP53_9STRA|nr:hypothetical protein As57867_023603 [Aphanomyces stellatus]VFU00320.1 Aste57867_23675 [Aphanomyces stellatus]
MGIMKLRTFFITYVTYATFHVARKSFGAIKGELGKEQWMVSSLASQSNMYGLMDMVFMGFYAVGLYVSGMLGDRINLRLFLSSGMVMDALLLITFGAAGLADIHNYWFYLALWGINGAVQSCGWPSSIAIMSKWFGHNERGVVMGMWSSCASIGNIWGGALVGLLYSYTEPTLAWKLVMITAGGLMLLQSLVVFCFLVPSPPRHLHLHSDHDDHDDVTAIKKKERKMQNDDLPLDDASSPPLEGISFWKACAIPGVLSYSIAYACVKSVTYSLFFWVPYYLTAARHMTNSNANLYSVMYDVGAILGGISGGFITDRMGVRSPYVVFSMCIAGIMLHFLFAASEHMTGVLLFLTGLLMGGPEMLITTSIAADLGSNPALTGNSEALATVTGIIDGTGSVGCAVMQYLVGRVANCHTSCSDEGVCTTACAWDSVFFLLQLSVIVGVVSLSRVAVIELQEWWRGSPASSADHPVPHRPVLQDEEMAGDWLGGPGPDTPGTVRTPAPALPVPGMSSDDEQELTHRT